MRNTADDDAFEAAAREALQLATTESQPRLSGTHRAPPTQQCPVAIRAVIEVMD